MTKSFLMTTGTVFNIQRYSIHDGPGIRTTVFLKGCPLNCWWCQNPESQLSGQEMIFWGDRCIGCGTCSTICPSDAIQIKNGIPVTEKEKCILCRKCTEKCPALAREIIGKKLTTEEVIKEIEKDLVFYEESGGGVTFSGGEPLEQFEFLEGLLNGCRAENERTFFIGEPTKEQKHVFNIVYEAQNSAREAIKPGMTAGEVDTLARKVIQDAGYGEYFFHRTGHGIGIGMHEEPSLRFDSDLVLQEGMVFSIEPAIFAPGIGGFRHSDNVILTKGGSKLITEYPRELESLIF